LHAKNQGQHRASSVQAQAILETFPVINISFHFLNQYLLLSYDLALVIEVFLGEFQ